MSHKYAIITNMSRKNLEKNNNNTVKRQAVLKKIGESQPDYFPTLIDIYEKLGELEKDDFPATVVSFRSETQNFSPNETSLHALYYIAKPIPKIPDEFYGPISKQIFHEPIVLIGHKNNVGRTYEKSHIDTHFEASDVDPVDNTQLKHTQYVINHTIKSLISSTIEKLITNNVENNLEPLNIKININNDNSGNKKKISVHEDYYGNINIEKSQIYEIIFKASKLKPNEISKLFQNVSKNLKIPTNIRQLMKVLETQYFYMYGNYIHNGKKPTDVINLCILYGNHNGWCKIIKDYVWPIACNRASFFCYTLSSWFPISVAGAIGSLIVYNRSDQRFQELNCTTQSNVTITECDRLEFYRVLAIIGMFLTVTSSFMSLLCIIGCLMASAQFLNNDNNALFNLYDHISDNRAKINNELIQSINQTIGKQWYSAENCVKDIKSAVEKKLKITKLIKDIIQTILDNKDKLDDVKIEMPKLSNNSTEAEPVELNQFCKNLETLKKQIIASIDCKREPNNKIKHL